MASQIKIIDQDILKVDDGVVCHQTNCMGAAGGSAGVLFSKYPAAHREYKTTVQSFLEDWLPLRTVNLVHIKNDLYVCNMYAQYDYGTDSRKTEYGTFRMCLRDLITALQWKKLTDCRIYFPYGIGCGLGGGDWEIIHGIIKYEFADWNYKIIICKKY